MIFYRLNPICQVVAKTLQYRTHVVLSSLKGCIMHFILTHCFKLHCAPKNVRCQQVDKLKLLGVVVSKDLKLNYHVDYILPA